MADSIGLLSDSVRAVSLGRSGASQTVSGAVLRSQQLQGISMVSSLAMTSHSDGGSHVAGGFTAPRRPTFVSASDVAETTPVLRAPAGRSVSIAESYLQSTMVPVPGMSQQAHKREHLLEEACIKMAWGIEVLHQQYYERVQEDYASMPVGGSGLGPSLMTWVGTGAVPVAGPSGCVPPVPRGQGAGPVPPAS